MICSSAAKPLWGELYAPEMGRFERYVWVFQQLETALRDGLQARRDVRRVRKEERELRQRHEHGGAASTSSYTITLQNLGNLPAYDIVVPINISHDWLRQMPTLPELDLPVQPLDTASYRQFIEVVIAYQSPKDDEA